MSAGGKVIFRSCSVYHKVHTVAKILLLYLNLNWQFCSNTSNSGVIEAFFMRLSVAKIGETPNYWSVSVFIYACMAVCSLSILKSKGVWQFSRKWRLHNRSLAPVYTSLRISPKPLRFPAVVSIWQCWCHLQCEKSVLKGVICIHFIVRTLQQPVWSVTSSGQKDLRLK